MIKISLCMVIRNEEKIITRVLKWAMPVVDQIVIMDQGSTDHTPDLVKQYNVFYHRTTRKDLADIDRQNCYNLATSDYVLALDADELPDEKLTKYLLEIKQAGPKYEIYWFKFKNLVDGVDIHSILGDDWHPRFWRSGDDVSPKIQWPKTAHTFPQIMSDSVLFCNRGQIIHRRTLARVRKVHGERGKVIDPQNQQLESSFMDSVEKLVAVKKGRG